MEPSAKKDKKVWMHIGIIIGIVLILLVGLIVGTKFLLGNGRADAPIMLKEQCAYEMYEIRTGEVRLTYRITLQNNTGQDLQDFAMRGVLNADYKSGYLLDSAASVEQWGTRNRLFTLLDGQTETFDLVLTAPFYPGKESPSGALPQLYAIYPDGSEGLIETK